MPCTTKCIYKDLIFEPVRTRPRPGIGDPQVAGKIAESLMKTTKLGLRMSYPDGDDSGGESGISTAFLKLTSDRALQAFRLMPPRLHNLSVALIRRFIIKVSDNVVR